MPIRRYVNLAPPIGLLTGVNISAPTFSVSSTSGYPDPPFILGIDRGSSREEACLCTAKTGTTFTVERGYDATGPKDHDPGALIEHVHTAIDFREAKIVRVTTAERDAMFPNEIWDGRLIWNTTTGQLEIRDPEGPGSVWASVLPTGVTLPYAGATLPGGWLWAQGQEVSRTDYPKLFALLGIAFGAGNGSSTFNVPNLQRRFPLGRATVAPYNVLGATGGAMDHVHSNSPAQSGGAHSHTQTATGSAGAHAHNNPPTAGSGSLTTGGAVKFTNPGGHIFDTGSPDVDAEEHVHGISSHTHSIGDTGSTGSHTHTNPATSSTGGHAHTLLDTGQANAPFQVLNYIIRT